MTTKQEARENEDFMNELRKQSQINRALDIAEGRLLSPNALADALKVEVRDLVEAVSANRMFTLEAPDGSWVLPAFFAANSVNRTQIEEVSQTLGAMPGASKWEFFTSRRVSLASLTPVEALAQGKRADVLRAASAFMER